MGRYLQPEQIPTAHSSQQQPISSRGSCKLIVHAPGHYSWTWKAQYLYVIKQPTVQPFENCVLLNIQKLSTCVENCTFISSMVKLIHVLHPWWGSSAALSSAILNPRCKAGGGRQQEAHTTSQNVYNSGLYFGTVCNKHLLLRTFKFLRCGEHISPDGHDWIS